MNKITPVIPGLTPVRTVHLDVWGSAPGMTTLLLLLLIFFAFPVPSSAQTYCHLITSQTQSVLPGYAMPFDLATNQLLVKATCNSHGVVTIHAGTGSPNNAIYAVGYLWNQGMWQRFQVRGPQRVGDWLIGTGTAIFYVPEWQLQEPNYVLVYSCSRDTTTASWNCGCKDTMCTTSQWQMQLFQYSGM